MPDKPTNVIDFDGVGKPLDASDGKPANAIADGGSGVEERIAGVETIDPGGSGGGGGSQPRNRGGRPKGSKGKPKRHYAPRQQQPPPRVEPVSYPAAREKEALRKNLADLTGVILVAHATMASLVNIREIELSEDEAKKLSEASKEVLKHYPVGLSDKTLAWVNLAVIAGGIYGTRAWAYSVRKQSERRSRTIGLGPGSSPASSSSAPPPAAPNGHAADFDLTPPFLTVPPEGETVL